jgi:uncharacterized iron-regulated protein
MWFKQFSDEAVFEAISLQLEHLEDRLKPKLSHNINKYDEIQKDLDKIDMWVRTIKNKQYRKHYLLWIKNQQDSLDTFREALKVVSKLPGYPDWMR